MRTYVFLKDDSEITGANRMIKKQKVVGTLVCNNGLHLTSVQIDKINAKGIEVIEKRPQVAEHDGDMNRITDLLCENGTL